MLAKVRAEEFAKAEEENELALSSISVPIFGASGRLAAALTLAGPSARFGAARIARLLPALRSAAQATSQALRPLATAEGRTAWARAEPSPECG